MPDQIQINDRVEFNGRRGLVRGTVTDIKYSRPGSRNALVRNYGLPTPTQRKLVVMPDDGAGVWNVPEQMCKKIGQAEDNTAQVKASELINKIHNSREERYSQGREKADAAGLYDLKKGADIEVEFKGGHWRKMKFSHVTSSGRVGFYDPTLHVKQDFLGRDEGPHVRFSHAQFVRIPTSN